MIEVRDLFKYYGDRRAVGPLSFAIAEGEIVGLLGLNGAGKTTALRVLACDLLPSSGSVRVDGIDVVDQPGEVRRRIGYLPDTPPLYAEMTVHEYLRFAARLRGVTAADVERRVRAAEGDTQLDAVADDPISSLSHGFRQRVGIAQAVVHDPRLLILDEPITGLDPLQIVEMRQLLRGLRGKHTIVLSSHILTEISETCDRLLVLRQGEIVASGTEAELSGRLARGAEVEITVRAGASNGGLSALARERLTKVDGVEAVEALSPREPGSLTFRIETSRDVRDAMCRALVEADFGILEVVRKRRELEAIFLQLTSATDEEPASEGPEPTEAPS
jgi:ABC-2 type transport system ATP-binding protein